MRPRLSTVLCLLLAVPRLAAAYQQTDLQATWEFSSIASGPGAPWWERARAMVAADGSFTAYSTTSAGDVDTIHAAFNLSPGGVVTVPQLSLFRGALDLGTTVLVATDTWSGGAAGTTELKVGAKVGGGTSLSDLTGDWEINSIASGPGAPWWQRGRLTFAADGSFSGTFTDNLGNADPASGAFGVAADGSLTFAGSSTARGVMDAGKTVLVMTSTWTGFMAGTVDLTVGVKMAPSYTLADLAGTWEINSLATGPGAPWWSRGQITVAGDGSVTGSTIESDGSSSSIGGSLSITPNGVVTRSGSASARGVLDAGRTVMVWTDTWATESPGTTELLIATRTGGSTAAVGGQPVPEFVLEPIQPNPTQGLAPTVRFTLPGGVPARLELLDVSGRRIVARDLGSLGAGQHTLELGEGQRLAPGLYLVRLRVGSNRRVRRVVVL